MYLLRINKDKEHTHIITQTALLNTWYYWENAKYNTSLV